MAATKALTWDDTGTRQYETGVSKGVLYVQNETGAYPKGVAWNGLSNVTEKPTGAEATPIYADNMKYLNLYSAEEFEASVECYMYPPEFAECDGSTEIALGVSIGQQPRKAFGMSYQTLLGNDIEGDSHGYKIHLIYGAKASPSEKAYATVNDSPEAIAFSYELKTTPVHLEGYKPFASITIDSTKVTKENMKKIEDALYGTETNEPYLPMPDKIIELAGGSVVSG